MEPRSPSRATAKPGEFDEVLALIEAARHRAYQAVNTELVGLYWQLGEYISEKIASAERGDGVVDELAASSRGAYLLLPQHLTERSSSNAHVDAVAAVIASAVRPVPRSTAGSASPISFGSSPRRFVSPECR